LYSSWRDAGIALRDFHAPDFDLNKLDTLNTDPTVVVLCIGDTSTACKSNKLTLRRRLASPHE
jgi:hypothetical protein